MGERVMGRANRREILRLPPSPRLRRAGPLVAPFLRQGEQDDDPCRPATPSGTQTARIEERSLGSRLRQGYGGQARWSLGMTILIELSV